MSTYSATSSVYPTERGKWRGEARHGGCKYHVGIFGSQAAAEAACALACVSLEDGTSGFLGPAGSMPMREYAARVRVPLGTLKRWVHEGMPVLSGACIMRVDVASTDAWVAEHHATSVSFGRKSSIYIAQRDSDDAVKIGWTSDVERRMKELRRDTRASVCLIAAFPGDKPMEGTLHSRFATDRLDGEWFRFSAPLAALVASIGAVAA